MRNEYPRPNFVRNDWLSLNGQWAFGEGKETAENMTIEVPFVPQCEQSGLHMNLTSDVITYERTFTVPESWNGKRVILHFGAVDYKCTVWVNGQHVGDHVGGHTSFSFDITDALKGGEEHIKVTATDYLEDEAIPRGKQFWEEKTKFIWYTQSSGIWQSVWLEPVEAAYVEWVHFTPDIDKGTVEITYKVSDATPCPYKLALDIRFGEECAYEAVVTGHRRKGKIVADVFEGKAMRGSFHFTGWYWTPEQPSLFDVNVKLLVDDKCADTVDSYFGMRKIHMQDGKVYLNNQPYYQKLLLDQGYWKGCLMTAPTDEAFIDDIQKSKAMGFNGCRKHEKVEDPRFLYWADKLGFMVWEGMPSFWSYNPQSAADFTKQWLDVIHRDYNHPCVVVWNMLNESWGVPRIYEDEQQQHFARSLYHLAHAQDTSRLVIANDGWELTENDICAFHTYKHGADDDLRQQEKFRRGLKSLEGMPDLVEKTMFAKGFGYEGQPVLLTEIGGISLNTDPDDDGSWGYTGAADADAFVKAYERLIESIYESELIFGYCYTQTTDIEHEMNGLLDEAHEFKVAPEIIKEINDRRPTSGAFMV